MEKQSGFHKHFLQLIAGAGSGAITKTLIAPLDRIKILFQIQGMKSSSEPILYRGILQTAMRVTHDEGFLSLYNGNGANILRVIPSYALKFMFNDTFKELVKNQIKQHLYHFNN